MSKINICAFFISFWLIISSTALGQQIFQDSISDTLTRYTMSEIVIIGERLFPFNSANFHERTTDQIDPLDVLQADQAFEISAKWIRAKTDQCFSGRCSCIGGL
jgi:hypothetical protein